MEMRDVDLNLLLAFEAMLDHCHVTRAGEAIGLSQPAMSAALSRLRTLLGDPLFVKVGARMQPTARAQALAGPVRRVTATIRAEILPSDGFDAATSERVFTLITPDIGEMIFVPPLMAHLSRQAPRVRLNVVSRPRLAAAEALSGGTADLALGYFPDLDGAGFFRQQLFENRHICLLRQGHPAVRDGRLTLDDFLACQHVVVHPDGREHVFEQHLQQLGVQRQVVLELSHFMSLMPIVDSSDLVATVPRDLAELCQRYAAVQIVEAPVSSPVIPVCQFWHRYAHRDAAHVWLRAQVQSILARPSCPEAAR